MGLFARTSGAGQVLPLEPPRLLCTTVRLPPPSLKQDMKFVRSGMPDFKRFDSANSLLHAAVTVPVVDLLTQTAPPVVRQGDEGAPYHGPATLGYTLGAYERSLPAFTLGFTQTAWVTWEYWLSTEMSAKVSRTDSESLIYRGLAQWAVGAGRYIALTDVTADALRPALFSELAAELQKIFGPEVAIDHLQT